MTARAPALAPSARGGPWARAGASGSTVRCRDLARWLTPVAPATAAVLVDPSVAGGGIAAAVADAVRAVVPAPEVITVGGRGRLRDVQALSEELAGQEAVVAVGGGRVMDQVKLAVAMAGAGEEIAALLEDGSGGGFRFLPDDVRRVALLVAVPTTLGTGSERSQNVVVEVGDGRLLVGGAALRADLAVHDPLATRGLPASLLLGGVFEALSRTVGPFVGSDARLGRQDELVGAVSARLAAIGHALRGAPDPGAPATDDLRLEAARLGGLSQTPAMHAGRDPFGFKAWYLAHELAWVAGLDKHRALAAVLPAVWSEILAGNESLGSADRLLRVWAGVAETAPHRLSPVPDQGLRELLGLWGIPGGVGVPVDLPKLVERLHRRWGGSSPFLGGLDEAALLRTLARVAFARP